MTKQFLYETDAIGKNIRPIVTDIAYIRLSGTMST